MNFLHLANRPFTNESRAGSIGDVGMNLISHLRHDPHLLGHQPHLTGFPDSMSQRLLAVDVFPHPHRRDRDRRMHMVGCRDLHGINRVAQLREHFTIVGKMRHAGKASSARSNRVASTSQKPTNFTLGCEPMLDRSENPMPFTPIQATCNWLPRSSARKMPGTRLAPTPAAPY